MFVLTSQKGQSLRERLLALLPKDAGAMTKVEEKNESVYLTSWMDMVDESKRERSIKDNSADMESKGLEVEPRSNQHTYTEG